MFTSIKSKVILFYMVVLFVTLSLLGIFLYFSLSKIVYHSLDSSLLSRAKAIATLISTDRDETEFNFSDDVMWEYNSPKSNNFFQIRRFNGTTLEKAASLGNLELPFSAGEIGIAFKTILLGKKPVRLVNFPVPGERDPQNPATLNKQGIIVQCAVNMQDRLYLLKSYGIVLSSSVIFIIVISAAGGFLIAKKALTPIREISQKIDGISESNLSGRVSTESVPKELTVLASSFNRTFDRLEKAFTRQRQFAANASHELRTPLSVILSQSEILLRKERSAREYQNALSIISGAATIMSEIVQKLLALARLSTDTVELTPEAINLGELVRDSARLLRPLAEQKGVSIHMPSVDEAKIIGDRTALLELFSNLIENAIKYNVPGGKIDISFTGEAGYIVTEIRDTGIGIPAADLDKVFDRFYRAGKSHLKDRGGIGLGLSICREIVKLQGGRMQIESIEGEGTRVSVHLKADEHVG